MKKSKVAVSAMAGLVALVVGARGNMVVLDVYPGDWSKRGYWEDRRARGELREGEEFDRRRRIAGSLEGEARISDPVLVRSLSRASQDSFVGPEEISGSGRLYTETWVPVEWPTHPPPSSDGLARSVFEVSFLVEEAVFYELAISGDKWQDAGGRIDREIDFGFSGMGSGLLVGSFPQIGLSLFSGILLPDTYNFRFNTSVVAWGDPLGDLGYAQWNFALRTSSVPDGGNTFWLLGIGMGVIGILGLGRRVEA